MNTAEGKLPVPSGPSPPDSAAVSSSNSTHTNDDHTQHVPIQSERGEKAMDAGPGFTGIERVKTRTNPPMSLPRECLFVFVCVACQFFTQACLGMAMAPLLIIGSSFGNLNPGQLAWMISAFSLTVGTFILPAGRLGDMFGHKLMLVLGWLWLSIWCLVTGCTVYTQNQIFFDFCRAMQGVGCSILLPNGLALLGTTYPPGRRKTIVFSLFGATAPAGFMIAALFASLVSQLAWWPWAFWLMAIATAGLAVLGYLVVPNRAEIDDSSSLHGVAQKFDWWGTILGVLGLVLFNVAWNQAPNAGWSSPYVIVFLLLGVLLFVAFVCVEYKVDQPLVPMESIRGKSGLVLACMMLGWSSFGIWIFYYYQFALNIEKVTPLNVTAQTIPCTPAGLLAAGLVSVLIVRVKASWLMVASMVAFCVGNICFATNEPGRLYWVEAFWGFFITPFGMDMSFPAATLILSNLASKRHQGKVASLVTTIVNYSIAFGLGIAGTVEVHVNNGGYNEADLLKGYRGAQYAGIGLAGLGIVCGVYFVLSDYVDDWRDKKKHDPEKAVTAGGS